MPSAILVFRIDLALFLPRDRRHRRFFLFLKGVLVYALIHLWWNRWDLNPQPFPCKGIALPIAPRPHIALSRDMVRNKMS